MAPRKRRKKAPTRKTASNARWPLVVVVILAGAVGFLGAYLWEDLHQDGTRRVSGPDLAAVEAVVGRLDPEGVEVMAADVRRAEDLWRRIGVAADAAEGVTLGPASRSDDRISATLRAGSLLFPIEIRWPMAGSTPVLAVVIDDMGRDLGAARALLDLGVPITLSILPHLRHSRETAALCRERGRDYLLHLPMEPQGYPKIDPGDGALLTAMTEREIRRKVAEDVAAVPGVVGVNNHMGSRFTERAKPMGWVAAELADRHLFFLDSLTSGKSVAHRVARDHGVGSVVRDVFLDNERTPEAVDRQLDRAVEKAKQNGRAVAIGHPHKVTVERLRAWAGRLKNAGVRVVPLEDLVDRFGRQS